MKKYLALIVIGLLFSGFLAGCDAKNVKITKDMNGETISVEKGDTITLSLAGNSTTGFNWELIEMSQSILAPEGEPDYKSGSMLIGSGGVYTYKFNAVQAGSTTLKLVYHRSWEKDIPPAEMFEVFIEVK